MTQCSNLTQKGWRLSQLIFFLLVAINVIESGDPPPVECTASGVMSLTNDADVQITEIIQADGVLCSLDSKLMTGGKCNQQVNAPIKIMYKVSTASNTNQKKIVKGTAPEYFILKCSDIQHEEKGKADAFVVSTPKVNGVANIPMKFGISLKLEGLEQNKKVAMGHTMTLIMEGPDNTHLLQPEKCTAIETNTPSNTFIIWRKTPCKGEPSVIENNWVKVSKDDNNKDLKKKTIKIPMHAFRFISSSSVKIECFATICPSTGIHDKCTEACINPSRKRRNVQTGHGRNSRIMYASTSFQVIDPDLGNHANGLSTMKAMYSVPVIIVVVMKVWFY